MSDRIDGGEPESIRRRDILPEDRLPPRLTKWGRFFLFLARVAMVAAVLYIVYICVKILLYPATEPECICWSYIALVALLSGLISEFFIRHKMRLHEKRKEDRSEIEALIQDAKVPSRD